VHLGRITNGKYFGALGNSQISFIGKVINEILSDKKDVSSNAYKKHGWFVVGLLFASGEMKKLLNVNNGNATQVAKIKFGKSWDKYRPYISGSISINTSDKNIFSNNRKTTLIINHCKENNIDLSKDFLDRIPSDTI